MDKQASTVPKRRSHFRFDTFCLLVHHEHDIDNKANDQRSKERQTLIDDIVKEIDRVYPERKDDPVFSDLSDANIHFFSDRMFSFLLPNAKPIVEGNIPRWSLVTAQRRGWKDDNDETKILNRKGEVLASLMTLQQKIYGTEPDGVSPVQIKAISPDWVMVPGQGFGDGGGPGARPVPPETTRLANLRSGNSAFYQFSPESKDTPWWQDGSGAKPVIVAILDSAPTPDVFKEAQKRLQDGSLKNPLLKHLIGSSLTENTTPQGQMLVTDRLKTLYGMNLPPEDYVTRGHDYLMSDHGLFVSGIIDSLVPPSVDLYLVEVLNQHGCGTVSSIISGLSRFWEYLQDNKLLDRPIVVNASLRFDLPVSKDPKHLDQADIDRLKKREIFKAHPKAKTLKAETFANFVWQSLDVLRLVLFLSDQMPNGLLGFWRDDTKDGASASAGKPRRLLIAAAGNDHQRNNSFVPEAGYPAAEDNAVGVGALSRTSKDLTKYTNTADLPESVGYYTFGGDAPGQPYDSQGNTIAEASETDTGYGIAGLYLGEFPDHKPKTGLTDTSGWAEWAGTSFATPLIAGIAASLFASGVSTPMTKIYENCTDEAGNALPLPPPPPQTKKVFLRLNQG